MHLVGKQFFQLLLTALLGALLTGCGKRPETYDSLRGDVLADLAQALEDEDGAKISRSLDRLETLLSETEFVFRLRANEEHRHVLQELNRLLEEGDLTRAAAILESHRTRLAAQAEWLALPRQIEALEAVDAYLAGKPHDHAEAMAEALQTVQRHARHVATAPVFTAWLQAELDALARLRQQERRVRLAELLATCDQAVVQQAFDRELSFARLRDFAPQSEFAAMHRELREGETEAVDRVLATLPEARDPLLLKGTEIFLLSAKDSLSTEAWLAPARRLAELPAQSLSGRLLRVHVALADGRRGRALLWTRRYLEAGGAATANRVDEIVDTVLLPPRQFNARIWRVPFPSVDDVFGRIVQWHGYHAREEAAQ